MKTIPESFLRTISLKFSFVILTTLGRSISSLDDDDSDDAKAT